MLACAGWYDKKINEGSHDGSSAMETAYREVLETFRVLF